MGSADRSAVVFLSDLGLYCAGLCGCRAFFAVPELASIPPAQTILLMAGSLLGSFAQLPAIGGGSQVAIMYVLTSVLHVGPEAATHAP